MMVTIFIAGNMVIPFWIYGTISSYILFYYLTNHSWIHRKTIAAIAGAFIRSPEITPRRIARTCMQPYGSSLRTRCGLDKNVGDFMWI